MAAFKKIEKRNRVENYGAHLSETFVRHLPVVDNPGATVKVVTPVHSSWRARCETRLSRKSSVIENLCPDFVTPVVNLDFAKVVLELGPRGI